MRNRFEIPKLSLTAFATLFACSTSLMSPPSAHAAVIKAAKATKALIDLDPGERVAVGDTVLVMKDEHEAAALEVTAVKGRQALADIKSGETNPGDKVQIGKGKPGTSEKTKNVYKMFGGGVAIDSQKVKLTQASEVGMTGMSPMIRASYSGLGISTYKSLEWELGFSFEQLKTLGRIPTDACKGTRDCAFEITSLAPYARAGWLPLGAKWFEPALRVGLDVPVPLVVNSNVIDYNTFNPLMFVTAGAQFKIKFGENKRIPVSADYSIYVGNSDVSIMRLLVWAGYSWR